MNETGAEVCQIIEPASLRCVGFLASGGELEEVRLSLGTEGHVVTGALGFGEAPARPLQRIAFRSCRVSFELPGGLAKFGEKFEGKFQDGILTGKIRTGAEEASLLLVQAASAARPELERAVGAYRGENGALVLIGCTEEHLVYLFVDDRGQGELYEIAPGRFADARGTELHLLVDDDGAVNTIALKLEGTGVSTIWRRSGTQAAIP